MTTKFLKQWGKKQQGSPKTYPWFQQAQVFFKLASIPSDEAFL